MRVCVCVWGGGGGAVQYSRHQETLGSQRRLSGVGGLGEEGGRGLGE